MAVVTALNGAVSIYATDKRSVGNSSFLDCPSSLVTNFSACKPFIQQNQARLKANTFTNTARDLQYVVKVVANQRPRNSTQRTILMGSSQGTYLLQRLLHLIDENDPIDAIILDSVLPTDITRLIYTDTYFNYILLDLFTRCTLDQQGCANKFENSNPMRALYTYKMNDDFQHNSSCLALFNVTSVDLGKKVSKKH